MLAEITVTIYPLHCDIGFWSINHWIPWERILYDAYEANLEFYLVQKV